MEHVTWLLHGSCLQYLYPCCMAGLNKSHQAGSDSSHVDSVPNVIWRLGKHEIGPSRASLRDDIPSLDERLVSPLHVCMRTEWKRSLTRHARLTYFPNSEEPSVQVSYSPPPLHATPSSLFYFPPSPVILCTIAATVMDLRNTKPTGAPPKHHTHEHAPLKTNQINRLVYILTCAATYFSTHAGVS